MTLLSSAAPTWAPTFDPQHFVEPPRSWNLVVLKDTKQQSQELDCPDSKMEKGTVLYWCCNNVTWKGKKEISASGKQEQMSFCPRPKPRITILHVSDEGLLICSGGCTSSACHLCSSVR